MRSRSDKDGKLTIGRLAKAAGVGLGTVRFYQRRGLLSEPDKPQYGGFRVYGTNDLERLLQIKKAQEYGFTLTEIQRLLACRDERDCVAMKTLVNARLETIETHIRRLEMARKFLADLRDLCPAGCEGDCPMMERLCEVESDL